MHILNLIGPKSSLSRLLLHPLFGGLIQSLTHLPNRHYRIKLYSRAQIYLLKPLLVIGNDIFHLAIQLKVPGSHLQAKLSFAM